MSPTISAAAAAVWSAVVVNNGNHWSDRRTSYSACDPADDKIRGLS